MLPSDLCSIELPPGRRDALRPLFASMPGLRGCVDAALATKLGFVNPQPYTAYELRP